MEEITILFFILFILSLLMWTYREKQLVETEKTLSKTESDLLRLHIENGELNATIKRIDEIDSFNDSNTSKNVKYFFRINGLKSVR